MSTYSRILVPVDGSEAANRGLMEAIAMGKCEGTTLRLIHVVNELMFDTGYAPTMNYDQLVESMREGGKEILGKADVIVMGTHGRRGLKRLAMGSDAEMVLRLSPVPVLMVRQSASAVMCLFSGLG